MKTIVRILKYTLLLSFISLVSCKDSATSSDLLRWHGEENDFSDLTAYVGSPTGGVLIDLVKPTVPADSINIVRGQLVRKYLDKYVKNKFAGLAVEFIDDDLMLYKNAGIQLISTYKFENGKLFIFANGSDAIVADGVDKERLTIVDGIFRYPKTSRRDTVVVVDTYGGVTLDMVLKACEKTSLEELINPSDTIVWCNVKYTFTK